MLLFLDSLCSEVKEHGGGGNGHNGSSEGSSGSEDLGTPGDGDVSAFKPNVDNDWVFSLLDDLGGAGHETHVLWIAVHEFRELQADRLAAEATL